ncbi:MAG: DUF2834 domain-containing protein [Pseudomonadota bacterium]
MSKSRQAYSRLFWLYLLLCVPGTILPLSQFLPWFFEHGFDVPRFFGDLFSNNIGGFFGWDVIVASVALLVFIVAESRRRPVPGAGFAVIGGLVVGVSLGLPLFLALRERATAPAPTAQI